MTRFERKYYLESIQEKLRADRYLATESILHFTTSYPNRKVHNIYFDDHRNSALQENVEGLFSKRKVRVRWYDNNPRFCQLEVKSKEGELGSKRVYPFETRFSRTEELLATLRRASGLLEIFPQLEQEVYGRDYLLFKAIQPVSYNDYHRSYLVSGRCDVRLTIDSHLTFTNLRNGFAEQLPANRQLEVYEIKYDSQNRADIRLFEQFITDFPLRMTRFSKFANSSHLAAWA